MCTKKENIQTLIRERKFEEALEVLVILFEDLQIDAEIYYLMGTCFYAKEDISNSVRFLKKAVDIEPENTEYLVSLALAYEAFEESEKAFHTYLELVKKEEELQFATERLAYLSKSAWKVEGN